jgi:alpha 1,6-mannosyltransferase
MSALRAVQNALKATRYLFVPLHEHWYTWPIQLPRALRVSYGVSIGVLVLYILYWFSFLRPSAIQIHVPAHNVPSHLPNIPQNIWQLYLDFSPAAMDPFRDYIHSWIAYSPSYNYAVIDALGASAIMQSLPLNPSRARLTTTYEALNRRVMRGDFLRYLLLALRGGVYSDMDTTLLKPIHEWVPEEYKNRTRLIIGLEGNQNPPPKGMKYPVQFCQWTIASAPDHALLWAMVESIAANIADRTAALPQSADAPATALSFSDDDVLEITGPAAWTVQVFKALSDAEGTEIGWQNLTDLKEPRLYGDIWVLPIDGFATGLPHSGSDRRGSPDALVRHWLRGSWKGETRKEGKGLR